MNDLDEKRTQLQDIATSIVRISPQWSSKDKGKILHVGGRTCALQNVDLSELLEFLDKTEDSVSVIAISESPARNFKVIFRI